MKFLPLRSILSLLSCLSSLGAAAAPTADAAPAPSSENSAAMQPQASPATAPSDGDKTVDLLIQLQPRSAGFDFNERSGVGRAARQQMPAAASGPTTRLPADAREAQMQSDNGLFGSGATPTVTQSRAQERAMDESWQSTSGANANGGRANGATAEQPSRRWLFLPRELVLFIRDNREWIVGSVIAAVALFWIGSASMARRHR